MTHPKLSNPSSGLGGRGYKTIFEGDGKGVVPSITTALGALEKPGIVNWHVENTCAFAVANVDALLSRTEEQGMGYLRWYTRRLKPEKLDDPETDILDYSAGVLDDLAQLGNFIHEYVEADLNNWFDVPEPWREDQAQLILSYHDWKEQHDIEVLCTERTVFGDGYAGTFDAVLNIDGETHLVDIKTSRRVYDSHIAQLAAISAAKEMATEVPEGTDGAVHYKITPSVSKFYEGQVDSWWVSEPVPAFQKHSILQIRPDDWDKDGNFVPSFAFLHEIDQRQIDVGFELFRAGLDARHAQRRFKQVEKELENFG